jgi:RimJ/RimL family protein N-acetyltransferase
MKHVLLTERLRLREFTLDDTSFIMQLLNTPGWLQFIGDRNIKTPADATRYLREGPMKSYAENGFGLLLAEQISDGAPVGMAGLLKRDYLPQPDIGFALLPDFMNQGFALETVNAILQHAKDHLNLGTISAIVLPANVRSISLLQKTGFRFVRRISVDKDELSLYERQTNGQE